MKTSEIQELLEGMLGSDQAAEVLHRLSVSPEKLEEFRGHLALSEAIEQDARVEGLDDEEDDALWAAVLGATGGLVTGGAAAGTGALAWFGRVAAFLATGIAGFFIGTSTNNDTTAPSPQNSPTAAVSINAIAEDLHQRADYLHLQAELAMASNSTDSRIDTLYLTRTITKPQIVYRDRVVAAASQNGANTDIAGRYAADRDAATQPDLTASDATAANNGEGREARSNPVNDGTRYPDISSTQNTKTTTKTTDGLLPSSPDVPMDPAILSPEWQAIVSDDPSSRASTPFFPDHLIGDDPVRSEGQMLDKTAAIADDENLTTNDPTVLDDPNKLLEARKERDEEPEISAKVNLPGLSLMRDGFEIGYNERIGRVAPAPIVAGKSDPGFDARSLDLAWRTLGGRAGFGIRAGYGSFSRITYTQQVDFDLGLLDTSYVESLGTANEWSAQVFAGYRLPIVDERLALDLEGAFGLSSSRFTLGADLSAVYLITDWLGARAGLGYGLYRYTTEAARTSVFEQHENAGIRAGLPNELEGTLIEGRYGLFYRF